MAFEDTKDYIGVSAHYGAREAKGINGNLDSKGLQVEYALNLDDAEAPQVPFPEKTYVTAVYANGATALTIGGVDVIAATDAAPVEVPAGNTGVIVVTGQTAGTIYIKYLKGVQLVIA